MSFNNLFNSLLMLSNQLNSQTNLLQTTLLWSLVMFLV
jgi:hypothetical protein